MAVGDDVPAFAIAGNYPNPFNPSTVISYELPRAQRVTVAVYDAAGRRVAELVDGHREMGTHQVRWDGRDDDGRRLSNGIYFYELSRDGRATTQQLLLLQYGFR